MTLHLRRVIIGVAVTAALAGAGWILASNMAFRVTYEVQGPADSASGTNWLSLPYRPHSGLVSASDLYAELGGGAAVASVSRFDPVAGTWVTFSGGPGNDFTLIPGEGLIVTMNSTVQYALMGSHDPQRSVTLLGPEESAGGENFYAHPYHAESETAGELLQEIGPERVSAIARLLRASDAIQSYTGSGGDFTLVAGESYRITVTETVHFVPKTRF